MNKVDKKGSNSVNALVNSEENLSKVEQLEHLTKKLKQEKLVFGFGVIVLVILLLYMLYGTISAIFHKESAVNDFGEYTFTFVMQDIPKIDIDNVECMSFEELRLQAQTDEHFEAIDGVNIVDLNDASLDEVVLYSYDDLSLEIVKMNRNYEYVIEEGLSNVPSAEHFDVMNLDASIITYLQKFNNITLAELELLAPGKSYSNGTTSTEFFAHDTYYADNKYKESDRVFANYDEIKTINTYSTFNLRLYDGNVNLDSLAGAINGVLESYDYTLETSGAEALVGIYNKIGEAISTYTSDFTLTSSMGSDLAYASCDKTDGDKHHDITIIIKDHAVGIPLYIEYYDLFDDTPEPTEEPTKTPDRDGVVCEEFTIIYDLQLPRKVELDELTAVTIGDIKKLYGTTVDYKKYTGLSYRNKKEYSLSDTSEDAKVLYSKDELGNLLNSLPRQYTYEIKEGIGLGREVKGYSYKNGIIPEYFLNYYDTRNNGYTKDYYYSLYDSIGGITDVDNTVKDAYNFSFCITWYDESVSIEEIAKVVHDVLTEYTYYTYDSEVPTYGHATISQGAAYKITERLLELSPKFSTNRGGTMGDFTEEELSNPISVVSNHYQDADSSTYQCKIDFVFQEKFFGIDAYADYYDIFEAE